MTDIKDQLTREKALLKLKTYAGMVIIYALLRWTNFFSHQVYLYFTGLVVIHVLLLYLEIKQSRLVRPINGIFLGLIPSSIAYLMPNNLLLSFSLQYMALNFGLNELKWNYLPFLFGSNLLSWVGCYFYYELIVSNDSDILSVKNFLGDSSQVNQISMSFALYCINLTFQGLHKYMSMTAQEKYESKLLQLNTDLEIANTKLQNSNKDLQDALDEKENFILRFSHEIRNPLNCLLGNIELCYEQATDKELEQMLKDAKVSGEILLQLLNNVLDTAKVVTGRLEVSLSTYNIRHFLERAWVICSEIIRKRRLYGCLSVNMNVPEVVEFDHHRLMQILINTVSNAAKFTDKGYVKVHVDFIEGSGIKKEDMLPKYGIFPQNEEEDERLNTIMDEEDLNEKPTRNFENLTLRSRKSFRVSQVNSLQSQNTKLEIPVFTGSFICSIEDHQAYTRKTETPIRKSLKHVRFPEEGYIRFEIVDSGCGISQQFLENVFKKFQQVNSNSSKRQIGTGLGLWITKEIIEMMNGNVEIFSKPNRGTTIVIMVKSKAIPLPTANRAPSLTFSNEKVAPTSSSGGRVLIVEDIAYNQEINQKLFLKCGVGNVAIANNGKEAVDLFLKMGPQYFDLILMDIDMPVMDGKTAVKIIRQEEKKRGWSPVNIVFLTGFAEAKTQKQLLDEKGEYRANGFYSKPASIETFKRIVRDFVTSSSKIYLPENCKPGLSLKRSATQVFPDNQKISVPMHDPVVLVVDDDSFNLTMVAKMLKLCKINTIEAHNGKEAIRVYEENWERISCILMDCEMPVLDGLEATQRILAKHAQRAALLGKRMNIYGLTGHVGKEYRQKCLDVGMKNVLEKPINIEVLSTLLKDSIP